MKLEHCNRASCVQIIEALRAENEALRRDAERYRYIRDQSTTIGICTWDEEGLNEYNEWKVIYDNRLVDATIDAEMKVAPVDFVFPKGSCPNCGLPIYCKRCAAQDDKTTGDPDSEGKDYGEREPSNELEAYSIQSIAQRLMESFGKQMK